MNDQDKCPFCGSEQLLTATPDYIWWRCGTWKYSRFGTEQSITCRNIERDALKARIAQLEEAVGLALKMRRDWLSLQNEGCAGAYEAFVLGMNDEWDKIAKTMEQAPKPMETTENADAGSLKRVVSRLPACKGTNCGCTDGVSHSKECRDEYEVATAMPYDEQWLHEPDDGRGWKCHVCNYGGSANKSANVFCANCHRHN